MSTLDDDMFSGVGQMRLDMLVDGNLLRNAAGALAYNSRKSVLEDEERAALMGALKRIPVSMDHLRKSLTNDDDFLAIYRLVEAAYAIGALTQVTDAMPKIAAIAPGTEGGFESGKARKAAAERGWKIEALQLAQACVAANPSASQATIAKYIVENFKGSDAREFETYRAAVGNWRNEGKLPKIVKKVR